MTSKNFHHIETLAVHAGQPSDKSTGAVVPGIYLATNYERDAEGGYPGGFSYSRSDNPNRRALEECLAALENASFAITFSSGLGVAQAVLQALSPQDHIVVPNDVYHGVRKSVLRARERGLLDATFVDMTDRMQVAAAIRSNTRLIWLETPSNPLLRITDLEAISALARGRGILTLCDNTLCTAVLQRPLDHGVDMVMYSTTKYIAGHSDVVGGALLAKTSNPLLEEARLLQQRGGGGGIPSPFDCWLTLRGIATLPLRIRAQSTAALEIANRLVGHPKIEAVLYPGLVAHPQHSLAAEQMKMFSGVLSFLVKGSRREAIAVEAQTKLFTRATSLGGTHSLIEHRASTEGEGTTTPQNLLRLSIGLENVEDLIGDLEFSLSSQP